MYIELYLENASSFYNYYKNVMIFDYHQTDLTKVYMGLLLDKNVITINPVQIMPLFPGSDEDIAFFYYLTNFTDYS